MLFIRCVDREKFDYVYGFTQWSAAKIDGTPGGA